MIDQVWPLATAVMAANFATIMLIYGLRALSRIREGEDEPVVGALAVLVPLAFFGGGVYLYW